MPKSFVENDAINQHPHDQDLSTAYRSLATMAIEHIGKGDFFNSNRSYFIYTFPNVFIVIGRSTIINEGMKLTTPPGAPVTDKSVLKPLSALTPCAVSSHR